MTSATPQCLCCIPCSHFILVFTCVIKLFNSFLRNVSFGSATLKTLEKFSFSDVFTEIKRKHWEEIGEQLSVSENYDKTDFLLVL